jgi:hypothetical protein
MNEEFAMNRSPLHTSWAAAYSACAELSRRNYDVAFTMGNTPKVDLLCCSPEGTPFKVQVKGISNTAGFWVRQGFFDGLADDALFLIVVYVPKDLQKAARFFVLNHLQAKNGFDKMPKSTKGGKPYDESSTGLNWGSVTPYEDKWNILPT